MSRGSHDPLKEDLGLGYLRQGFLCSWKYELRELLDRSRWSFVPNVPELGNVCERWSLERAASVYGEPARKQSKLRSLYVRDDSDEEREKLVFERESWREVSTNYECGEQLMIR